MENRKGVLTPMEADLISEKRTYITDKDLPYQNLIGSFMYLAVATRLDIQFAVSCLNQFNNSFGKRNQEGAKRILRYLKFTKQFSIALKKTGIPIHGLGGVSYRQKVKHRILFCIWGRTSQLKIQITKDSGAMDSRGGIYGSLYKPCTLSSL